MCSFIKPISITNGIVPIAEFKASISRWFRSLQSTGRPLVITQNGKPVGVLLTPKDYDALVSEKSSADFDGHGNTDVEDDKNFSKAELKAILKARRSEK